MEGDLEVAEVALHMARAQYRKMSFVVIKVFVVLA